MVIFEDLGNKRMVEGNLPPFSDGLGKRLERQQRLETAVSEDQQDE